MKTFGIEDIIKLIEPKSRVNASATPLLRFTRPFLKFRAHDLPEIRPSAMNEPYNTM
jgi:hypothetical protein